jgi:hypothetical protein
VNRRAFAESLALAALAPALGVPVESLRLSASPAGTEVEEDAVTLALMLVEIIRLEHGGRLTEAELAGVAEQVRAGLDRADLIRRADRGYEA